MLSGFNITLSSPMACVHSDRIRKIQVNYISTSGILNRSTYSVQPGTYRLVLRYRIILTCTAPFEYVLFPQVRTRTYFFSQVRTQYVLGQIVCTEYVLSTESMIKVRTFGEKYKLSWYIPVCTSTY